MKWVKAYIIEIILKERGIHVYPPFLNLYYIGNSPTAYHHQNAYYSHSPMFSFRQYPSVDPAEFMSSAKEMESIMKDASILLMKMATSRKFSIEFMSAAQEGKQSKIQNLLKSTGIKKIPKASYTPDGLYLHFEANSGNVKCCQLTLKLRWG